MRMLCLMIPDCHVCSIINYTRETFANQFRSVLEIYSCDARSFLKILRVIKQILFIREFLAAIAPEAFQRRAENSPMAVAGEDCSSV